MSSVQGGGRGPPLLGGDSATVTPSQFVIKSYLHDPLPNHYTSGWVKSLASNTNLRTFTNQRKHESNTRGTTRDYKLKWRHFYIWTGQKGTWLETIWYPL